MSDCRGIVNPALLFCNNLGEHVTLDTILEALKNSGDVGFQGSRTSLHQLLLRLGFTWKKTDARRVLLEDPKISGMRRDFLRQYQKVKEEGWMFVYLDETWFFSKGCPSKTWQDGTTYTCKRLNLDQGKRFIVLDAGSEQGFVKDAGIVFAPGSNLRDYHGTMNGEMFEKWLQEQLLPRLQEPSAIVLDNAPYHSVQSEKLPTSKWTKVQLTSRFKEMDIQHCPTATRPDLYKLAKQHKPATQHRVDILVEEAGHQVLRLPPYHCHYNAIESVWSDCKRYFYSKIGKGKKFDNDTVKSVWQEALSQVTAEKWQKCTAHTDRLIAEDRERELQHDGRVNVQPIIIEVGGNVSDDTDDVEDDPLAVPLSP